MNNEKDFKDDELIGLSKDSPLRELTQDDLRKIARSYNKDLDSDRANVHKYKIDAMKQEVETFLSQHPEVKPGNRSVPVELIYHKYVLAKSFTELISLYEFRKAIKHFFAVSGNKTKTNLKLDPEPFNFSREYLINVVRPDLVTANAKAKENQKNKRYREESKAKKARKEIRERKKEFAREIIAKSAEMDFSEQFKTPQGSKGKKRSD